MFLNSAGLLLRNGEQVEPDQQENGALVPFYPI